MALPRLWLASLPDDIVKDILTWLPPKPLVRFRCVLRCWKSNIADPEFIERHLIINKAKSLSLSENNNAYLLCNTPPVPFLHWPRVGELCTVICNSDSSFTKIIRLKVPSHESTLRFYNGIFCFVGDMPAFSLRRKRQAIPVTPPVRNSAIYLGNPSIRKHKRLPTVLVNDRFENSSYGLAFLTSQNNDLKLLVFGRFNREQLRAQVYTLRTNSWSWVELPVEPLDEFVGPISRISPSPLALHFIATTSQVYEFILCFDVDNEQFWEIKLPHNYSNGLSLKFKQLVVFKGSLALIAFGQDEAELVEVCRIWVMSEYGLADSWTPTLSVPLSGVADFLGCTGSGELVIMKSGNQVFSFDPENQNENDLGIQNLTPLEILPPLKPRFYTANLIESLVLLDE
ncbi:hypothetical protein SO802_011062 [Lithocarpus litseifolius]|uniref:F-box domain-containing protein n=1 Tax=Lithocarpus litseifolius TaxID=425828 RepID=A0AAW2DJR4_9ROSI